VNPQSAMMASRSEPAVLTRLPTSTAWKTSMVTLAEMMSTRLRYKRMQASQALHGSCDDAHSWRSDCPIVAHDATTTTRTEHRLRITAVRSRLSSGKRRSEDTRDRDRHVTVVVTSVFLSRRNEGTDSGSAPCPVWALVRHRSRGRPCSCSTSLAVAGRGDEDLGGAVLRGGGGQPAAPERRGRQRGR
jgi:hypothetical protein